MKLTPEVANAHVRRWLDEVANARVHATTKAVPATRLAEEQAVMLPAPALKAQPSLPVRVAMPIESLQHPLTDGAWHDIEVSRTAEVLYFYVDGTRDGVGTAYSGNLSAQMAQFAVGNRTTTYTYFTDSTAIPDVTVNPDATGYFPGDLASIENAAGHVTQFNLYDATGRIRQMTDSKGVVTDITYPPRGWPTRGCAALGATAGG